MGWDIKQLDGCCRRRFLWNNLQASKSEAKNIWFADSTKPFTALNRPQEHGLTSLTLSYVLMYVDDILITGSSKEAITFLVDKLNMDFALKDLGNLSYFLGIQVKHIGNGSLHLSRTKYIKDLREKAKM